MDSFLLALNAAKSHIRIVTPYFIPTESIMKAITTVSRSGVEVELMIPFEGDSWIVQAASLSYVSKLLQAGVKVYLYKKGFIHAKVIIIDETFASVGTANMDSRSFNMNYEINTYLYEKSQAEILIKQFETDLESCDCIHLEKWKNRRTTQKLKESICRLLAPLL
jgi:cardiolipin synthase